MVFLLLCCYLWIFIVLIKDITLLFNSSFINWEKIICINKTLGSAQTAALKCFKPQSSNSGALKHLINSTNQDGPYVAPAVLHLALLAMFFWMSCTVNFCPGPDLWIGPLHRVHWFIWHRGMRHRFLGWNSPMSTVGRPTGSQCAWSILKLYAGTKEEEDWGGPPKNCTDHW